MRRFAYRSKINCSPSELFAWHESADALEKLTPVWLPVSVGPHPGGLIEGTVVVLRLGAEKFGMNWVARIGNVRRDVGFEDIQVSGPFKSWRHSHNFIGSSEGTTALEDRVEYSLPLHLERAFGWLVDLQLLALFRYRHCVTRAAFLRA